MARGTSFALAALVAVGCGPGAPAPQPGTSAPPAPEDGRVRRARELLKQAEAAPLPTPPPPPSPLPRGWVPVPAPDFKAEEVEAIRLLEEAAAAQPRRPEAHELLARLLEPSAVRRHQRAEAARGSRKPPAPSPPDQGVDASPPRVVRAYRAAIEATPQAAPSIEDLIAFGLKVGDLDAAEWGHRERVRRAKENTTAEPLALYGDFLLEARKDPLAAAEQYRNALIWAPEDANVRAKVAGIYLGMARDHFAKREYAAAEARLREAAKHVPDPASPQGRMLEDYRRRLAAIRR